MTKVLSHIDFSEFSTLFSWIKNKLNIDGNIRWRELRTKYHVVFYLEIESKSFFHHLDESLMVAYIKGSVSALSPIQIWDKVPTLDLFFEKYKKMFLYRQSNHNNLVKIPNDLLELEIENCR